MVDPGGSHLPIPYRFSYDSPSPSYDYNIFLGIASRLLGFFSNVSISYSMTSENCFCSPTFTVITLEYYNVKNVFLVCAASRRLKQAQRFNLSISKSMMSFLPTYYFTFYISKDELFWWEHLSWLCNHAYSPIF